MDWSLFLPGPQGWGDELLAGLWLTLRLGLTSVALGTGLGLAAALAELSRFTPLARLVAGYNLVMRSVPELLVIFLLYYGLSFLIMAALAPFGIDAFIEVSPFWAGALALSLIHAAYASEVFRGAFQVIPKGQIEAAQAFGMGRFLTFRRIKLPVALRLSLAGLANLLMATLKNTPLVSAIGLQDLIRVAGEAGQNTKLYFQFFMVSLSIYLAIAALMLVLQARAENRLFAHLRRGAAT
jgi:His/Glu/Gln/Arg/opine family amino acid ABC transporter permease subunit